VASPDGLDISAVATAERVRRSNARVFAAYLLLQAVVGILFWVALEWSPDIRKLFELTATNDDVTDAFFLADLLVGVAGSAAGAWALWSDARWGAPVVAFTAGGLVYPTLFLVAWVARTDTGDACLLIMVPPSIITSSIAWWATAARRPPGDRERETGP
jgi:hypothetical protein